MKGFRVFNRTKSQVLKDSAASATEYATALAKDRKFRRELLSAMRHGTIARRRASSRIGFIADPYPAYDELRRGTFIKRRSGAG